MPERLINIYIYFLSTGNTSSCIIGQYQVHSYTVPSSASRMFKYMHTHKDGKHVINYIINLFGNQFQN